MGYLALYTLVKTSSRASSSLAVRPVWEKEMGEGCEQIEFGHIVSALPYPLQAPNAREKHLKKKKNFLGASKNTVLTTTDSVVVFFVFVELLGSAHLRCSE